MVIVQYDNFPSKRGTNQKKKSVQRHFRKKECECTNIRKHKNVQVFKKRLFNVDGTKHILKSKDIEIIGIDWKHHKSVMFHSKEFEFNNKLSMINIDNLKNS